MKLPFTPAVRWTSAIVGLLGMSLVIHGILIVVAISDPAFAIEPDHEATAENYNDVIEQRRINAQLGWQVDLGAVPNADGLLVALSVRDASGTPLADADVRLTGFHIARSSRRDAATLRTDADGNGSTVLGHAHPGTWEFRVTVTHAGGVFTDTIRRTIGRAS